jgi:adenosyl cobinamide kinase/adenosyl cobinamide phosphate guanylyltransferase
MPKAGLIVYLGGLRSGKSRLAQDRFAREMKARKLAAPAYLATLVTAKAGKDAGLKQRVASHQAMRPKAWATVEIGAQLEASAQACIRRVSTRGSWMERAPGWPCVWSRARKRS